MSIKDTVVQHLPVPNPESSQEMWIVGLVVSNVVRTGSEVVFLSSVTLLILYLLGLLAYRMGSYFFTVYAERLRGPQARVFGVALGIFVLLALGGGALMFSGEREAIEGGLALLATTFCAFSVFTVVYDWRLLRSEEQGLPSLKELTAEEVIRMHKIVQSGGNSVH